MTKSLKPIFLTCLSLFIFAVSSDGQPSIREIGIDGTIDSHDFLILKLLEPNELPRDFAIVDRPSFGSLERNGVWLTYTPYPHFADAGGDVFTFQVGAPREGDHETRLVFLSPEPVDSMGSFSHGFDGSLDGWTHVPEINGGVFTFTSPAINGQPGESLRALLTDREEGMVLQTAHGPFTGDGGWGGGTTLIVCPEDDPSGTNSERRSKSMGEDGEVTVYRAVSAGSSSSIELRVKRDAGQWSARVATLGAACIEGRCASAWVPLATNTPELVSLSLGGFEETGYISLAIGSVTRNLPVGVDWNEFEQHDLGVLELNGLRGRGLVFDDFSVSGYFDPFVVRAADSFESGVFSNDWDDLSLSAPLQIRSEAALSGLFGLRASPDAWGANSGIMTLIENSVPTSSYAARFKIDASQLSVANREGISVLGAISTDQTAEQRLLLRLEGKQNGMGVRVSAPDSQGVLQHSNSVALGTDPVVLVVRWESGNPGKLMMWVDGVLAVNLDVDNPNQVMHQSSFGLFDFFPGDGDPTSERELKLDDFVAW